MSITTKEEAIANKTKQKERKAENNVLSEDELNAQHIKQAEKQADKKAAEAAKEVEQQDADTRPYGENERNNKYYKANGQY